MTLNLGLALQHALDLAFAEARLHRSAIVGTPHLFIALTKLGRAASAALRAHGYDPKAVRDDLSAALGYGDASPGVEPQLTPRAAAHLKRAKELARLDSADQVEEHHLLAAILGDDEDSYTLRALRALGMDIAALRTVSISEPPSSTNLDVTSPPWPGRASWIHSSVGSKNYARSCVHWCARERTTQCWSGSLV